MATKEKPVRRQVRPLGPGEVAAVMLEELEISQTDFAQRLDVSRVQVNRFLNGHVMLTPDMAHRLGRFFGNGPTIWMNLQKQVDLWDLLHMDTSRYENIETLEEAELQQAA